MKLKALLSLSLAFSLCSCGILSDSGGSSSINYGAGAIVGTAAGAGIGAAIGSAISNGDVANSAYLGAGIGLAVGTIGLYAYDKISTKMEIASNEELIESNRQDLLAEQAELDSLRQAAYEDSRSLVIDSSKREKIYNGATLGVYYR